MQLTLGLAFSFLREGSLRGDPQTVISTVCTDTRALRAGALYVAVRGERFDGHDFLEIAYQQGAVAVLAQRDGPLPSGPCLLVPDTLEALAQLAAGWRRLFDIPVIAVTGSNGKTTVKEMISCVLQAAYGADGAWATPGNLNNHIGLPLSLLQLRAAHRAAVFELGTNHPGEIRGLAAICAPTVAMVNNAQREHQAYFAGAEASAQENGEVFASLIPSLASSKRAARKSGPRARRKVAVVPVRDPHVQTLLQALEPPRCATPQAVRRVGFEVTHHEIVGDGRIDDPSETPVDDLVDELVVGQVDSLLVQRVSLSFPDHQRCVVDLQTYGAHNVHNAVAAATCAWVAGVPVAAIQRGLSAFLPVQGRLQSARDAHGRLVLDDSYNANPDSVRAAIDVLAGFEGQRYLILGDMGEVGDHADAFHREVGAYARQQGVQHLLGVGVLAQQAVAAFNEDPVCQQSGGVGFADPEALMAWLAQTELAQDASLLVKGSRFMRMERVVKQLLGTRS